MLTFHLAGGQGGMAHMLDHFGPSLQSPVDPAGGGRAHPRAARRRGRRAASARPTAARIDDLVAERDRGVIAILRALGPRMSRRAGRLARAGPGRVDRLQRPPLRAVLRAGARPRHRRRDGRGRARPGVPRGERRLAVHRRGARALPRPGVGRRRPRGRGRRSSGRPASCSGSGTSCTVDGPAARHRGDPRRPCRHRRRAARRRSRTTSPPGSRSGGVAPPEHASRQILVR